MTPKWRAALACRPAPDTPDLVLDGGSLIVGPDGAVLAGPAHGEETILHVDVDLERIPEEMMTLDVTGHYARPDVFELQVDKRKQSPIKLIS